MEYTVRSKGAAPNIRRPQWQQTLLDMPVGSTSFSQNHMSESIIKLEFAIPILTKCDKLDAKDPKIIEALYSVVEICAMNGSRRFLSYYLSAETQNQLTSALDQLYSKLTNPQVSSSKLYSNPEPENILALWLTTIAIARPCSSTADGAEFSFTAHVFNTCLEILQIPAEKKAALFSRCTAYLLETLDSPFTAEMLLTRVILNQRILECSLRAAESPSDLGEIVDLVKVLKAKVLALINSTAPLYTLRSNLVALHEQFVALSSHFALLLGAKGYNLTNIDGFFDRAFETWFDATRSYDELLQRALEEARTAVPFNVPDPYSVALISSMRLTAMLSGMYESVCYTEIQKTVNEMKSAAEEAAAWGPPAWRQEVEMDFKVVSQDILPFLRQRNPFTYKNACVETSTRGFLDLYEANKKKYEKLKETCSACGKKGSEIQLRKCAGCLSYWYCSHECQKNDWKLHKMTCKEIQSANKEARA